MNEPGRSPQDEALQRAIRQLDVADGPSAALDQRIRGKAHAAVRRRPGLPLWLSAVASVFVVFFAASLWRYQGEAPPPASSNDALMSAEQRKEGADAVEPEMVPSAPAAAPVQANESVSRREPTAAAAAGSAAPLSAVADDAAPAELAEAIAPVSRAQPVGQSGSTSDSLAPARQRGPSAPAPEPFPEPLAAPPVVLAPAAPAEPAPGRSPRPFAEAAKRVSAAPARSDSAATLADQPDAVEDELAETDRSRLSSGPAVGAESKREMVRTPIQREQQERDARAGLDQYSAAEQHTSQSDTCLAESAAECFDQARRLRDDGRKAAARALLRDTLERFDEPVPEDLRALLE